MASEKNAVALTGFFSSLFHNLPKLLFTNLLFAVPVILIVIASLARSSLNGSDALMTHDDPSRSTWPAMVIAIIVSKFAPIARAT